MPVAHTGEPSEASRAAGLAKETRAHLSASYDWLLKSLSYNSSRFQLLLALYSRVLHRLYRSVTRLLASQSLSSSRRKGALRCILSYS